MWGQLNYWYSACFPWIHCCHSLFFIDSLVFTGQTASSPGSHGLVVLFRWPESDRKWQGMRFLTDFCSFFLNSVWNCPTMRNGKHSIMFVFWYVIVYKYFTLSHPNIILSAIGSHSMMRNRSHWACDILKCNFWVDMMMVAYCITVTYLDIPWCTMWQKSINQNANDTY